MHQPADPAGALGRLHRLLGAVGDVDILLQRDRHGRPVEAGGHPGVAHGGGDRMQRLGAAPAGGHEGRAAPFGDRLQDRRMGRGAVERRHRRLLRAHREHRVRDVDILALEAGAALGQRLFHHPPVFDEDLGLLRHVGVVALELVGLVAGADADHRPSAGQLVEQRDLLGNPHRVIERQHDHAGAKPDAAGDAGHVGGDHQRRDADRIVGEMVLGEPGDLEATSSARRTIDRVSSTMPEMPPGLSR
ncbi:hypothetical protein A6302_04454 [Methylobrevis pamukkalensis]|uniref:Uncharacterized protein n=1 Tax=Methylobrevis pamukkalensis TaxID=1439726 RepID=A0A1E3GRP7_9HYPH|nr:hypothetical protein A6302_04454 [Methylobrevis pamukkalensis]